MKYLKKIAKSPWFLAIFPTVVTILLLPDLGNHYSIATEEFNLNHAQMIFEDINSDGASELIYTDQNGEKHNSWVGIASSENHLYDQWNIWEVLESQISGLYFGDYDHDRLKEIYIFSRKQDSLFLNVNEFFDSTGLQFKKAFITKLGHKQEGDLVVKICGLFDEDGDGKNELYFTVTSGYGLWPRLAYYFDLNTKKLTSSPYTSISLNYPEMKDVDGDGRPEILSLSTASGNHHFPTPYSDYSTWIMVLDDNLQFKFPPIGFEGFGSSVQTKGINTKTFKGYVSNLFASPVNSKEKSRIMLLSLEGKVIKERLLSGPYLNRPDMEVLPYLGQERIFVFTDPVLILDENLETIGKINLPKLETTVKNLLVPWIIDYNNDHKHELIIRLANNQTMALYDHNLELMGTFNPPKLGGLPRISNFKSKSITKLYYKDEGAGLFINIIENQFYFFLYLIYPTVYFAFGFFLLLVQKITTAQVRKQEQQKRRIQELQLRSIKGQLDPHFTFNALNAIGSMLQLEDRNVAYDYLSKFTRMLRQLISDADRIFRSLEEELEFATAYLQLEKIRFEEKFDFVIHVNETVTKKEMVPIMCIQIFAENAIRHGIMSMENGGLLSITVQKEKDYLVITIQDNGIGRKKAHEDNPHHGRGLKMTREFYDIINQTNAKPINFVLEDLHDREKGVGTRVEVRVPLSL